MDRGVIQQDQKTKRRYHRNPNKKCSRPFIRKLSQMLVDPLCANIVRWEDSEADGLGVIVIIDKERLENELLPLYYKHSQFTSFVRQLNLHGFRKSFKRQKAPVATHIIYTHSLFKKSSSQLFSEICRNPDKGKKRNNELETDNLIRSIKELELSVIRQEDDPHVKSISILRNQYLTPFSGRITTLLNYLSSANKILTKDQNSNTSDVLHKSGNKDRLWSQCEQFVNTLVQLNIRQNCEAAPCDLSHNSTACSPIINYQYQEDSDLQEEPCCNNSILFPEDRPSNNPIDYLRQRPVPFDLYFEE